MKIRKIPIILLGIKPVIRKNGIADVRKRIIEIFLSSYFGTKIVLIIENRPRISVILWTLPPRIFPKLISKVFSEIEEYATAISGIEAATESNIKPKTISPNFVILAIFSVFFMTKLLEMPSAIIEASKMPTSVKISIGIKNKLIFKNKFFILYQFLRAAKI